MAPQTSLACDELTDSRRWLQQLHHIPDMERVLRMDMGVVLKAAKTMETCEGIHEV